MIARLRYAAHLAFIALDFVGVLEVNANARRLCKPALAFYGAMAMSGWLILTQPTVIEAVFGGLISLAGSTMVGGFFPRRFGGGVVDAELPDVAGSMPVDDPGP